MTKGTDGAPCLVGPHHRRPEDSLVDPLVALDPDVAPNVLVHLRQGFPLGLINRHDELMLRWFLGLDVDGVDRFVIARTYAEKPDQRKFRIHSRTKRPVLWMQRVRPTPLVPESPVCSNGILIRSISPFGSVHGADRQGRLRRCRLPDPALGIHKGNPDTLELELAQHFGPEPVTFCGRSSIKPPHRGRPKLALKVQVPRHKPELASCARRRGPTGLAGWPPSSATEADQLQPLVEPQPSQT